MICCVEDDENIRDLVTYALSQSGFEAGGFSCAGEFYGWCADKTPELVLLDIMLPGEDGLSILKKLRSSVKTASIPVIMLTAKSSEYDRVVGLDGGADDYVTKPFGVMELVARVRALLRRTSPGVKNALRAGSVELDPAAHTVTAGGEKVTLTLKEFALLRFLMENVGRTFARDKLLERIWGFDYDGGTRTVDVHVQTLRQKLGACGSVIETVRGVGYKLGGDSVY